ncbi:MAG: hypothetical protein GF418_04810 [Chitinivibrionales bacterium]|nr:hypothetical protein [Chitinivibrionales bacterium]MBD3394930.1 hypothetical protein [Chitinivibrionales bacterium]
MIHNLYHVFASYYAKGGFLMIPIFLVSIVAWFMGLDKLIYLSKFTKARKRFLKGAASLIAGKKEQAQTGVTSFDSLLGELVPCRDDQATRCSFSLLFKEFLSVAVPDLDRGFNAMKAWISVAPLLGLLGTVNGMIDTFTIITKFGFGNPSLMAEGISKALITPQAGLTVAFPMMLFHNYLVGRSNNLTAALLKDGESLVKRLGSQKELAMLNLEKK